MLVSVNNQYYSYQYYDPPISSNLHSYKYLHICISVKIRFFLSQLDVYNHN